MQLASTIDWRFLEERFGAVYTDGPGQPPLPTRLMAGLERTSYGSRRLGPLLHFMQDLRGQAADMMPIQISIELPISTSWDGGMQK